jgi:hypothetical protein
VPYQFDFGPENKIIRVRFSGRVTDEELKTYYREAAAQTKNTRAQAGLIDFSQASSFDVSRETVLELAALEPALADPKAVRVIVATSPAIYGMARMFELSGEATRPNLHVVRTHEEAWAILGAGIHSSSRWLRPKTQKLTWEVKTHGRRDEPRP